MDDVVASVAADPDLATPAAKCDVYVRMVGSADEPDRATYPTLLDGACARFPLPAAAPR